MTPQEINTAIAEHLGWKNLWKTHAFGLRGDDPNTGEDNDVPNYCGDLNAMHEAQKMLTESHQYIYAEKILPYSDDECSQTVAWAMLTATARQRAEAFLRTIGKWEEST